jgi:hypothetical protein
MPVRAALLGGQDLGDGWSTSDHVIQGGACQLIRSVLRTMPTLA